MLSIFRQPVPEERAALLKARWDELPADLRRDRQVVGRHWTQCGYTVGPSYCSFGCTHCYLPRAANKLPMPGLAEMKAQIDANRRALGPGGNIQITGGDVVDAYLRTNRFDELVEVSRYADEVGLNPMLMTHGQALLDDPSLLVRLVTAGRLRQISFHIDVTQAGRAGYPVGELHDEAQLHDVRDAARDLLLRVRRQTGVRLVGAQTVTISRKNVDSIGRVFKWFSRDPRNCDAFSILSFQVEADVGRTKISLQPVGAEETWNRLSDATGIELTRDIFWFGHPDCSSVALTLVDARRRRFMDLTPDHPASRTMWEGVIATFGGVGASGARPMEARLRRFACALKHPGFLLTAGRYLLMLKQQNRDWRAQLSSIMRGQSGVLKIVIHNFMDREQLAEPRSKVIQQRLDACAFRGAHLVNGEWQSVPMCLMNSEYRDAGS